jgi:hypothetical protein
VQVTFAVINVAYCRDPEWNHHHHHWWLIVSKFILLLFNTSASDDLFPKLQMYFRL